MEWRWSSLYTVHILTDEKDKLALQDKPELMNGTTIFSIDFFPQHRGEIVITMAHRGSIFKIQKN